AQVRRRDGILQHGSIPITIDLEDQIAVMPGADERIARQVLAGAAMSVTDLLGRPVSFEEVAEAIAAGFAQAFGVELRPKGLSEGEQRQATALEREKYATPEWNERVPARPRAE
ncbi:MAG: lipoate--protein ligase family protein, partial [Armatimonadota bacterium]